MLDLIIIASTLVIAAGISNSVMDVIQFYQPVNIFTRNGFNEKLFGEKWWKNKYINQQEHLGRRKLFWKFVIPVQFTEPWHFSKMIMIILLSVFTSLMCYISVQLQLDSIWQYVGITIFQGVLFSSALGVSLRLLK